MKYRTNDLVGLDGTTNVYEIIGTREDNNNILSNYAPSG